MPERIQLRRTKGWRMPPNTASVCRPGKWGNIFVVSERVAAGKHVGGSVYLAVPTVEDAVECCRLMLEMGPEVVADAHWIPHATQTCYSNSPTRRHARRSMDDERNLFQPECAGASREWHEKCERCRATRRDNCGDDAAFNAQIARRNSNDKPPLPHGAPTYTVRVERMDYASRKQSIEFDGYALLRELLAGIEAEAEKRGWFEDTSP